MKIEPYSVPIKYFIGASTTYSNTVPPTYLSLPSDYTPSVNVKISLGPSSFLVSHHKTLPSVDVVTNSEFVLLFNQTKSVTGSK